MSPKTKAIFARAKRREKAQKISVALQSKHPLQALDAKHSTPKTPANGGANAKRFSSRDQLVGFVRHVVSLTGAHNQIRLCNMVLRRLGQPPLAPTEPPQMSMLQTMVMLLGVGVATAGLFAGIGHCLLAGAV